MATPPNPNPNPPGPGQAPSPNPPTRSMQGDRVQVFREIVTAIISITILSVTVWMMVNTYQSGRQKMVSDKSDKEQNAADVKAMTDAFGREKDLLLYALALLGTVTGYYLGRVPAELRAQQAQQTANTTQTQLASTQAQLGTATITATQAAAKLTQATAALGTVRSKLALASAPVRGALAAHAMTSPEQQAIVDAENEIEAYFRRQS